MRTALPFYRFSKFLLASLLIAGTAQALVIKTSPTPRGTQSDPNGDGFTTDARVEGLGDGTDAMLSPQYIGGIVSFKGTLVVTDSLSGGSRVLRAQLNSTEAWGADLPNGFKHGPTGNPEGPWYGMNFPFRDFMNFPDSGGPDFIPGGNNDHPDNGSLDSVGENITAIRDIFAESDANLFADRYRNDPLGSRSISFFSFLVDDLTRGETPHYVDISFYPDDKSGVVALVDAVTGEISYVNAEVEGFHYKWDIVPSPGTATLVIGGSVLALSTRRRRT